MIDLDADTLTLRRGVTLVEQYDGTPPPFAIVQSSPVVSRAPCGDVDLSILLHVAMREPEVFRPPQGMEYCSTCGDWRPRSYFAVNPAFKRGLDYVCKGCKSAQDRQRRELVALQAGRELRVYRKRAA